VRVVLGVCNRYDDGVAVSVRGHCSGTAAAPSHLNLRTGFLEPRFIEPRIIDRCLCGLAAGRPAARCRRLWATLPPLRPWLGQRQSWLIHDVLLGWDAATQ